MLIKGVLHVHSQFSKDGQLPLAAIAKLYRRRGFQFVCIAEHSQDMNDVEVAAMRRDCESLSGPGFCMVPGLEYSCPDRLHIVGVGCDLLLDTSNPVTVARNIRAAGGFAVLAHPRRIGWGCDPELCAAVNAIEVWNVGYDGKYVPSPRTLEFFNWMKALNPTLLAAVGDDFHRLGGFYPLSIEMSVTTLDRESILQKLILGRYRIGSMAFRMPADSSFSAGSLACVRALRFPLNCAKSLRDMMRSAAV